MSQSTTENLKRYKDIAWLLVKYGRADWARGLGLDDEEIATQPDQTAKTLSNAEALAEDLERLGPTFIKLGQLLSTRADLLPPVLLTALSRLQDRVAPFPFEEVERVVEGELGARLSKAFEEFEPTPLAAASLGQVHRATLRDGRPVAVKVQRPGIHEQIAADLDIFRTIAKFLDGHTELGRRYEFEKMVDEFAGALASELDYRQEAGHLSTIRANLREFVRIVIPEPVADYTTPRLLTMGYVQGSKVTSLSPLARLDLDGNALAEELFRAYLKQILVDGFFHADPHPGNVLITEDGKLALLDLGMVARLPGSIQEVLLRLLAAVAEGDGDNAANQAAQLARKQESFDAGEFHKQIAAIVVSHHQMTVEQLQIGRIILDVSRAAGEAGARLPSELTMLAKTLLNLDQIGRTLAPEFDPNASVRRNMADLLRQRAWKSSSAGSLAAALLDTKEFVEKLPSRMNRVLDLVASNDLHVRVDAIDEGRLIDGLHKIANRIALGLVLAALIVGSALFIQVPTAFRILGYPGLAVICFLGAMTGGFVLIASIVVNDRKKPPRAQ